MFENIFLGVFEGLVSTAKFGAMSRLENTMFGTNFSNDDNETRINRISSAYKASKSASKYDSNRFSQNMTTAMQIGTLLLMVLACIL